MSNPATPDLPAIGTASHMDSPGYAVAVSIPAPWQPARTLLAFVTPSLTLTSTDPREYPAAAWWPTEAAATSAASIVRHQLNTAQRRALAERVLYHILPNTAAIAQHSARAVPVLWRPRFPIMPLHAPLSWDVLGTGAHEPRAEVWDKYGRRVAQTADAGTARAIAALPELALAAESAWIALALEAGLSAECARVDIAKAIARTRVSLSDETLEAMLDSLGYVSTL